MFLRSDNGWINTRFIAKAHQVLSEGVSVFRCINSDGNEMGEVDGLPNAFETIVANCTDIKIIKFWINGDNEHDVDLTKRVVFEKSHVIAWRINEFGVNPITVEHNYKADIFCLEQTIYGKTCWTFDHGEIRHENFDEVLITAYKHLLAREQS